MLLAAGPRCRRHRASTRVIGEDESGLVIKRFGRPLPSGRIIALDGEAGYQARLLPPGWHFGLWRWRYKVVKVPVVVVQPGEIALVVAADGAAIPPERVLARAVACDNFQDAEAFLRNGGERGRQIAFLTAGTYRINPALFEVVTPATAKQHDMSPADLHVYQMPPDRVGIVTMLDGRPIPAGDLAGPVVAGHDSFQRGQAFIDAGGCRGLQEEVLLSGSWNLNPWLVQVEQVPLTEIPIGYVGVVVSYVGREHLDVSGDDVHARRPRRARPQGRLGRAAAARQASGQHAGDEGRARADDEHRAELGAADRGASVRSSGCRRSSCARRTASRSASTCRRSSTSA